ncbi:MAG: ABC transporter substrate-binding protein [Cellulomonas sp.]
MKRRVLKGVGVAAAAGLALTACTTQSDASGSAGGDGSGGSLSVATRWTEGSTEGAILNDVIAKFTADTGIDVELISGGENIDVTVETSVAAGQSPDLVAVNLFDKTLGWLDKGVTVPVDDYLTEWGLDGTFNEAALQEWRVGQKADGALQGFPYSGFAWPVWYNTELLATAGVDAVPTTTDELKDAATKLRAAGIGPMIVGGNDWSGQKLFFQIIQSYLPAGDAQTVFAEGGYCANPEAMKGIDEFVDLRDAGVFVDNVQGFTADDMNNTYYTGGAAMMPAGSWAMGPAVEADTEGGTATVENTTLGGFPAPSDGGAYDKPLAFQGFTGVGFMLTPSGTSADQIDKTKSFIEYFLAPDVVSRFVEKANFVTPVEGDFAAAATNPLLAEALTLDTVEYGVVPDVWLGSNADKITQVTGLAFGNASADEICDGLDQAYS